MASSKKIHSKRQRTITGTVVNDVLCLVFGIIVGFVVPFLLWVVTVSYFLTSLAYHH